MFGKKKSLENDEKERRENAVRHALELSGRTCSDLLLDIDQASMQAFTHGEELKKADDFRNQAAADQEKTKETLLRASEKTALSSESLEREHAALESASQALRQDKDAVTEMIENGRHSTDIAKNLFASADSLKDRAHAMTETVDQMEVMGRNMSVLALNSAIEAGRLGAGSERYVQAAEQVRNYAEQYGTAAREIGVTLKELNEAFESLTETCKRVTDLQMKNSVLLGKTLQRLTDDENAARKAITSREDMETIASLRAEMEELLTLREETSSLLSNLKEEMDKTGEGLMEGRSTCQNMEERVKKLQESLKETAE